MNNDLVLLKEAMDVYRPFPVSKKNVNQVLETLSYGGQLDPSDLINRVAFVYGGSRLNALCKVAQSLISCKVTINAQGLVEMYHV